MLFAELKNLGKNVELVQECVKEFAWQGKHPTALDQFYFFGEQSRREHVLFNKTDFIITDSPLSLCAFYTNIYGTEVQRIIFPEMVKCYYDIAKTNGHKYIHVWVNRVKPYNPTGRFQTEEESIEIDRQMRKYLVYSLGLDLIYIDGDQNGIKQLLEVL
jgi:hypothetical protein